MKVSPFGDSAVLIELEPDERTIARAGPAIDERTIARALSVARAWEEAGLGCAVPAYASVLGRFDPLVLAPGDALARARALATAPEATAERATRLIEIPTVYDGPDLDEVAALSRLTRDELVGVHALREYTAYFLGFMPGFAYCGPLDPRIDAPRLAIPRARVPAGSVAIADGQTGVYPFDSPGGWRVIAHTGVAMFDPSRERPALIAAGDRVRFVPQ